MSIVCQNVQLMHTNWVWDCNDFGGGGSLNKEISALKWRTRQNLFLKEVCKYWFIIFANAFSVQLLAASIVGNWKRNCKGID